MKFFTADICDAFDSEEIFVLDPVFTNYGGKESCFGQVSTLEIDEDNTPLIELLKTKVDNRVAVVDVKGDKCAVVGENLMNLAEKNGWIGIIVHGYVRDIHQTKRNTVSLFALSTYPRKSRKKADGKFDCELNFAGVTIKQDDYLYADLDGIIITKQKVDI